MSDLENIKPNDDSASGNGAGAPLKQGSVSEAGPIPHPAAQAGGNGATPAAGTGTNLSGTASSASVGYPTPQEVLDDLKTSPIVMSTGAFRVDLDPPPESESQAKIRALKIFPNRDPSAEQLDLYANITATQSALLAAFSEAQPGTLKFDLLDQYLVKLYSVAQMGLQSPGYPKVGMVALKSFRDDILTREAPRIKNDYMQRLGSSATLFALVAVDLLLLLQLPALNDLFANWHAPLEVFGLLWVGAMAGCWLSFGVRNPQLTVASLAQPDSDLHLPPVRLLFTGLLALTLGLIFFTGIVEVSIGLFDTKALFGLVPPSSAESGSTTPKDLASQFESTRIPMALLIGLFCGIGEQALTSTIGNRANQFIAEVAK